MTVQKRRKDEKDKLQSFFYQLRVEWRSNLPPCASITGNWVGVLEVFGPDEGGQSKGENV
jgi:hypothetical protein